MNKLSLILIFVAFTLSNLVAQEWNGTTTDDDVFINGNQLFIDSDAPYIQQTVNAESTTRYLTKIRTTDDTSEDKWSTKINSLHNISFRKLEETWIKYDFQNDFISYSNVFFGIGTGEPGSLLHIHGTGGNTSGYLLSNSFDEVKGFFDSDSENSSFNITYVNSGSTEIELQSDGDVILGQAGNVAVGTTTPSEKFEVKGNMLIRNSTNNGALILSPSYNGRDIDSEFYIQSAETGSGNGSDFHISRNAAFRTSDDTYQYIDDDGEEAISILFEKSNLNFNYAPIGTGAINWETKLFMEGPTGNIGIGNVTPAEKMQVTGNLLVRNPTQNGALILSPASTDLGIDPEFYIQSAETGSGNGPSFHISRNAMFRTSDDTYQYIDDEGEEAISILFERGNMKFNYAPAGTGAINWETQVFMEGPTGNVGIGTTNTLDYKLAVNGSIGSKEIKVESPSDWPDFVFDKDYELRSLSEVENYIDENNHLPEIPSQNEVEENGLNLGEMDAKLLQKIEELTLYMIEMNKRIDQLEKENKQLKDQVNKYD